MQNKNILSSPILWIVLVTVLLCCCLILFGGGVAGLYFSNSQVAPTASEIPSPTMDISTSTPEPGSPTPPEPTVTPEPTSTPTLTVPATTLNTLEQVVVPPNDPADLARRLKGIPEIPETVPSGPFAVGDNKKFWVSNVNTHKNFQVNATLRYLTEHSYFWIEDGVKYNKNELKALAEAFETKIYPTNREFFGSEWTPGIDGDPHIYILYARKLGRGLAGYFSSADEINPLAHKYSNAHEMFVFNADNVDFGSDFTYGVLAHEFQHMIHWKQDRNETSWLNEGFSELAAFINGYSPGGFDYSFIGNPDIQLTDWPNNHNATGPHYGAGFLFTAYFLDRFGDQATQALVRSPKNGMDSVDEILHSIHAADELTGQIIQADDFFMDWAVTNYLGDDSVADGRYAYKKYADAPRAFDTESLYTCPTEYSGTVSQYGTDYIKIGCDGQLTLRFEGATETQLLPAEAYSGKYAFWSNKGDESDMTLTREFDFTGVTAPIDLQYQAWYDLEKSYDYLYVEASIDGGQTWTILETPSGTDQDLSGNSYGWGYNGATEGWVDESVDLSQYAGQKIQLRFEYVTDAAVNGEGFLLDDVSVPAINYFTDFETDDGGWQPAGFARIQNILPQTFRLALILKGSQTTVQMIPLNPDQTAEIHLDQGMLEDAILVVSGTTRFTRDVGDYRIIIEQP